MCVIAYYKKSKPNFEDLVKMDKENSDGMGITYFRNGFAYYYKGIRDVKELFSLTKSIKLPFVLHFRWASCGGTNNLLCHPFEVTRKSKLRLKGRAKRLLMHNGTHREFKEYLAAAGIYNDDNEPMSDTRAIAMIISRNNERFLTTFEYYKHRFILADANLKKFITFGNFTENEGNFFSNMIWKYQVVIQNSQMEQYYPGFEGVNHRGYSSGCKGSSAAHNSDIQKLPFHYQDKKIIEPIVGPNESLGKLMSKKERKEYSKWFRINKIKNPLAVVQNNDFINQDTESEIIDKVIEELESSTRESQTIADFANDDKVYVRVEPIDSDFKENFIGHVIGFDGSLVRVRKDNENISWSFWPTQLIKIKSEDEQSCKAIQKRSEFLPSEFKDPKCSRIHEMSDLDWAKEQKQDSELFEPQEPEFVKNASANTRKIMGLLPLTGLVHSKKNSKYYYLKSYHIGDNGKIEPDVQNDVDI